MNFIAINPETAINNAEMELTVATSFTEWTLTSKMPEKQQTITDDLTGTKERIWRCHYEGGKFWTLTFSPQGWTINTEWGCFSSENAQDVTKLIVGAYIRMVDSADDFEVIGGCSTLDDSVDNQKIRDLVCQTIIGGQKGDLKVVGKGDNFEIHDTDRCIYLQVQKEGSDYQVSVTGEMVPQCIIWFTNAKDIKDESYEFIMTHIMRLMVEEFFWIRQHTSNITVNYKDKDMSLCNESVDDAVDLMFDAVMDDHERRYKGDAAIIRMKKTGEEGNGICCSGIYWEGLTATLWTKHEYVLYFKGKQTLYKDMPFRVIEMLDTIRGQSRICTEEEHHPMCSSDCK